MRQGFLQALGVTLYCTLVALFMWNANSVFGKEDTFLAPVTALTLFSTSALICALIVFYKPYRLFFSGKKKEALSVVVSTAVWLFVILALFLLYVFVTR